MNEFINKTSRQTGENSTQKNMTQKLRLTEKSLKLFIAYAIDSDNWSGSPLVGGNVGNAPADKGNLTHLKKLGLVTTHEDSAPNGPLCFWLSFTESGKQLAAEMNHPIEDGGIDGITSSIN